MTKYFVHFGCSLGTKGNRRLRQDIISFFFSRVIYFFGAAGIVTPAVRINRSYQGLIFQDYRG